MEKTEHAASLVEVRRGAITESRHRGHLVAVDGEGKLLASLGDPETVTYLRSSAKPFQNVPFVVSGALDRYGFSERELAIACGSHNGDPVHTETVSEMLAKIDLQQSALQCGMHEPYSPEAARALRERGEAPNVLHNNCSGKHAAMLALALHLKAPVGSYLEARHPVQAAITSIIEKFSGLGGAQISHGIDGCGVPVHAMPLGSMALMYARLAQPPAHFDDGLRAACHRIVSAMRAYPLMVGGETESLDTALMRAARTSLVAKAGAEGLFTAAILPSEKWPRGLGLALKIADGDKGGRARRPAVVETLRQLGVLSDGEVKQLASYAGVPIRNHRGETVGETVASFELRWEEVSSPTEARANERVF